MSLAPLALFTFKRPDHTRRMIESLRRNAEFPRSPLWVFSDGPRGTSDEEGVSATRALLEKIEHPDLHLSFADRNRGLANSVYEGVSAVCERYGNVVVVEDDLVLSSQFLRYMNAALRRYANDTRVYQVSGHMFPVDLRSGTDAVFLPFVTSWGWATWKRAWDALRPATETLPEIAATEGAKTRFSLDGAYPYFEMLEAQAAGRIDSWAIAWNASVFLRNGLVLYPRRTLVRNAGQDGSGTHFTRADAAPGSAPEPSEVEVSRYPIVTDIDHRTFDRVKRHLRFQRSIAARISRKLASFLRP